MTPNSSLPRRVARALGPSVPAVPPKEAIRAGIGSLLALAIVGLFVLAPTVDARLGLYLIAPFGASSVLIFAVPNSPLAQPWSAIVGSTLAAAVGVAVCLVIDDPIWRIALAVSLAIAVMSLARAVHPPAGAIAMTAAMSPDAIQELGFRFVVTPVAVGTVLMVLLGVVYARATGRRYPFRQFDEGNAQGTSDAPPAERLGLGEEELREILREYRQSLNVGVEDLARLIGAAEQRAAGHRAGPLTAEDIMSRDLVMVEPDTPLTEVAELFRRHGFTSLPVVGEDERFLGVIFQIHLIRRGHDDAIRIGRGFGAAMARLLDRERESPARAAEIMTGTTPRATLATPLSELLPMLAEGGCDAVPVLEHERIAGIVTRTDLIAALVRESVRSD